MSTPKYNALIDKVRAWSNKPSANTISNTVIQDCLGYAADECYRTLRIPPLEATVEYTITADNNLEGGDTYTTIEVPSDLIEFILLRTSTETGTPSRVFHEVTDKRTFFDVFAEKYSPYNWMWSDDKLYIHPQLAVDDVLEIRYYRRLASLDALYAVIPINYSLALSDTDQPYLALSASGTPLYFAGTSTALQVFATLSEATAYGLTQPDHTVTTKTYIGREVPNWLRDQNERMLLWGALYNLGAYLFDDKMEQRYQLRFQDNLASINREEKWRRASGGNVQVNLNA